MNDGVHSVKVSNQGAVVFKCPIPQCIRNKGGQKRGLLVTKFKKKKKKKHFYKFGWKLVRKKSYFLKQICHV